MAYLTERPLGTAAVFAKKEGGECYGIVQPRASETLTLAGSGLILADLSIESSRSMSAFLSARDVCQRLRDAALGTLGLEVRGTMSESGLLAVDIEGWHLLLDFADGHLHHCEYARNCARDEATLDTWQRYGTDPVSLLSTWELAQIERLLREADGVVAQGIISRTSDD